MPSTAKQGTAGRQRESTKTICAVIYTGAQVVHQSVDLEEESETEIEIEEMEDAEIAATGKDHEIGTHIIVGVMKWIEEMAETEETVIEIGIEIKAVIDPGIGLENAPEIEMNQEQETAKMTAIEPDDVTTGTAAKRGRAVAGIVEEETIKEMLIKTKQVLKIKMVKDMRRATVVVAKIKEKIIKIPPGTEVGRRAWVAEL